MIKPRSKGRSALRRQDSLNNLVGKDSEVNENASSGILSESELEKNNLLGGLAGGANTAKCRRCGQLTLLSRPGQVCRNCKFKQD
mmetsp:Transcript_10085/g.13715  ORF Transcript_10085/g.13715 Transcript_10085/m.13715 type:complete len:85 (+) Transcript_10085:574-828(+)